MNNSNWQEKLQERHPHFNLMKLFYTINTSKKKLKPINPDFEKLRKCSTKKMLHKTLINMNSNNKNILLFYMKNCYIFEILTRKIINRKALFGKRDILLRCIEDPEFLLKDCSFDNNMIKNFCVGTVNFICRYMEDIKGELDKSD